MKQYLVDLWLTCGLRPGLFIETDIPRDTFEWRYPKIKLFVATKNLYAKYII